MMESLLLAILLFQVTYSTVHHVIPDDEYNQCNSTGSARISTLQYYLNNTKRYFQSNTELRFEQGYHYLCKDWLLQNVSNVTINGNSSILSCIKPSLGIAIVKATNITIKNFYITYCSKYRYYNTEQKHKTIHTRMLRKSAIFIYYSADVVITNTSITINKSYTSGIIGINIATRNLSTSFTNITVLMQCEKSVNNSLSGIMLFYYDSKDFNIIETVVIIYRFNYKTYGLCDNSFALRLIMMHKEYNVTIQVENSSFTGLYNSSALLYYAESCRNANKRSLLRFSGCEIKNNAGNRLISMFLIEIYSHSSIFYIVRSNHLCSKLANIILFENSDFINNTKMNSLINVLLKQNEQLNVVVTIRKCNICFNDKLQLINTDSELKLLKAISYTIKIYDTKILSNSCAVKNRLSLITLTSGILLLRNSVIIDNSNFESIVKLHSSLLQFEGSTIFSGNYARYILWGTEGSYYVHTEFSKVYIKNNFVYLMAWTSQTYTKNSKQICINQFITTRKKNLDQAFKNGAMLNFLVKQVNNIYTIPMYEINFLKNESFKEDCVWLANTAFQTTKSRDVLREVFNIGRTHANKTDIGKIPSSICPCSNADDYNCSNHEIGSTYSGQKLTIKLIIPEIGNTKSQGKYTTVMATTYDKSKVGCDIINAYEISQTNLNHQCNEYNYTIWYGGNSSECELYLGIEDIPEIFYVKLLPCPVGFSLQESKKGCYCDQVLYTQLIKITSCNIEDGTVHRPANSWISGEATDNYNTYMVSISCPFDYCLSHSSHLNLSEPDLQCPFGRSGLLCGHCPKHLSTVFGSSHCEKCSNVTLLMILPVAFAGIFLVLMMFILNLTVTNGRINTFIFYFNIVSINISMFTSLYSNPFTFIALSLFNLDLGVKTCFYDGMDDYAKTWLQLTFPVYLIFIALALIIGSRYFKSIQRLTAQRGLPVLATLFLLSYTKVLLTVCHAIFFYSTVIHLPSKHSTVVWSVDTSIPLFGIKFSILFGTCLALFLILIPFNILLLFTRSLMRFRFISTFKPLLDAYFGPYKDKYYYWTGLQLLLRAVFFGLSTLANDVNLTSGAILLGILLCVQGVLHPFKNWLINVQESVVLLNLLTLYISALYNDNNSKQELPIAWYLLFPVVAYFIIFICFHLIVSVCSDRMKQNGYRLISKLKSKIGTHNIAKDTIDMENIQNNIPVLAHNYENFQEPLIALND